MAGIGPAAIAGEANAMSVLLSKNEPNQPQVTPEAIPCSGRVFLTLSLSVLGIAVVYLGALYLIAR